MNNYFQEEKGMIKKVYDFLKQAKVFFVSTEEGAEPKVRPFGFVMIYEEKLYFCTNNQKSVYRQLQENPNVEICACVGTEWIRVKGRAVFDKSLEAKKQVFVSDPGMSALYKPEDEIFEVFYLENGSAAFCSMDGKSQTVNF